MSNSQTASSFQVGAETQSAPTSASAETTVTEKATATAHVGSSDLPFAGSSPALSNLRHFSPKAVLADYRPQRLPQFKNNPMIEALPASLSEAELFDAMTRLPNFDPEQQEWTADERIQMVLSLGNFMIPSQRHIRLARTLDSMLRAGYVGRMPNTPEHSARVNSTYKERDPSRPSGTDVLLSNPQLSTLLMGVSGMGKTTSVKTYFNNIPQVIYHPKYNVYQVTHIHVEMPSDGASIKGLAHGILHKLDELIPGANYYQNFAKQKIGADTLMRHVARLLNQHFVGFLIADEIQNLANAYKGKQTVMTELVSACNDLGVPILFIGTNKAAEVFSLDFRQSRRAIGHGVEHWERLQEREGIDGMFSPVSDTDGDQEQTTSESEWQVFLDILWSFQWVKNPVELDANLAKTMYYFSQGIIDVAIKLFAAAQIYAITEKIERITPEVLQHVYKTEMKTIHKMIDALRLGRQSAMAQYSDIAPIDLRSIADANGRRATAQTSDSYAIKLGAPEFVPAIASSLVSAGMDESTAIATAEAVAKAGTAKNLVEGVQLAWKLLEPKKTVSSSKGKGKKKGVAPEAPPALAPEDYRNVMAAVSGHGAPKSVTGLRAHQMLREMGMTQSIDEALDNN